MSRSSDSKEVLRELQRVNSNLERLIGMIEKLAGSLVRVLKEELWASEPLGGGLDADVLISLPSHLRKTAEVLAKLGQATAAEVASQTGRARAAESDCLNQLVAMGHLKKRRVGKLVLFFAE